MWETSLEAVLAVAVPLLVAVAAGWGRYRRVKATIVALANMFTDLSKALEDDKVTEEEFRRLFYKVKAVVTA